MPQPIPEVRANMLAGLNRLATEDKLCLLRWRMPSSDMLLDCVCYRNKGHDGPCCCSCGEQHECKGT
jgi:hypothetical protein